MNTIIANSRTEDLLTESQRLTTELQERSDELQRQQEELRRSNAELEDKAALLAKQNRAIEIQNFQIEQARRTLEERAEQLAVSSRYKSEFLANMSHELRTPAEQPARAGQAAHRERRGQPHRPAGGVRQDHPRRRFRPAPADQRHPRPVQGRGRADGRPPAADLPAQARRLLRGHLRRRWPRTRASRFAVEVEPVVPAGAPHRRAAPPAGAAQPAVQRGQVHPQGRGTAARDPRPAGGGLRRRRPCAAPTASGLRGGRHRHRHRRATSWRSSSRRSSQADGTTSRSTAAPAWACPSAATSPGCSAARSTSPASRARAARSPLPAAVTTPARWPRATAAAAARNCSPRTPAPLECRRRR